MKKDKTQVSLLMFLHFLFYPFKIKKKDFKQMNFIYQKL